MNRSVLETILGAGVLFIAGVFLYYAYTSSNLQQSGGYPVTAAFSKIDGIAVGSDVKMNGIKIGSVGSTDLNPQTFQAQLTLMVDETIKLPIDTAAAIQSDGLLGGAYVALSPGADDEVLAANEQIAYTQAPTNIVDLLGKFIFSIADSDSAKKTTTPQPEAGRW